MSDLQTLERTLPNRGASAASIEHHYDVSNDFFGLWLDEAMVYSCAQYGDGDSLEVAQRRKIDEHLDRAGVAAGQRLLDIGCGWGGLISRSLRDRGVAQAVGLTLSPSQARYIEDRYQRGEGLPNLEVRVEAWSDHRPTEPYDAIVSLGAFEHFAQHGMDRAAKVSAYREFFDRCRAWLRPGGQMSLQTITWGKLGVESSNRFIIEEIYPETDPPELSEIFDGAKGLFEPLTVRLDRHDYTRTLDEWRRRLRANRDDAMRLVPSHIYERYERYLALCVVAFHSGNLNLSRISFRRED